jgi:hypothetical protein
MDNKISPKYLMNLVHKIENALFCQFSSNKDINYYIDKWHVVEGDWNNAPENFYISKKENGEIDLLPTLHYIDGETLLKIAIDLGIETTDFIPSIPVFRNEIKTSYNNASATFEKAFKNIEEDPDMAVGLVNSALESIIKEILNDERITTKKSNGDTLYKLTQSILKEFQLFPNSDLPKEIKTIGSNLLTINQSIEKLRSEKTDFHGKTNEDYLIDDPLYAYFVINSVTTVALFLISFYKKKFPKFYSADNDNNVPEYLRL